ncbi:DUF2059 domain-containing protein [uncultured Helicobacter sp.]|uniref:DUF2059 domain-containing protein n=1 Tax=uncultured Helicobacter sp. TaxID=175537 RepID=UPI00261567B5|nr:DUF2059 domain-containing protein [uncultured Helicobacter sp.]
MSNITSKFSMPAFLLTPFSGRFAHIVLVVALGFGAVAHAADFKEQDLAESKATESSAKAPISQSYKKAFEKFLAVSKTNSVINDLKDGQSIDMLLNQILSKANTATAAQKKEIEKVVRATFRQIADDLQEAMLEIYQKYYTEADLNELSAFYQSGMGKKLADNTMNIMRDSQELVQVLIERHVLEMEHKLQAIEKRSQKSK